MLLLWRKGLKIKTQTSNFSRKENWSKNVHKILRFFSVHLEDGVTDSGCNTECGKLRCCDARVEVWIPTWHPWYVRQRSLWAFLPIPVNKMGDGTGEAINYICFLQELWTYKQIPLRPVPGNTILLILVTKLIGILTPHYLLPLRPFSNLNAMACDG